MSGLPLGDLMAARLRHLIAQEAPEPYLPVVDAIDRAARSQGAPDDAHLFNCLSACIEAGIVGQRFLDFYRGPCQGNPERFLTLVEQSFTFAYAERRASTAEKLRRGSWALGRLAAGEEIIAEEMVL